MNSNSFFTRLLGMVLFLIGASIHVSAQTDEPQDEDSIQTEESVVITTKPSKGDTTEVAWRDKKFVIITEEGVKRVEIIEVPREKTKKTEDSRSSSDEGFDPEYDNKVTVKSKNTSYSKVDPLGLDIGFLNYAGPSGFGANAIPTAPELEVRDVRFGSHVALHLLPTTVNLIGRGHVNLKTAVTIDWSSHFFKGNTTFVDGESGIVFEDTGVEFTRNPMTTRYLQIPLLLNFKLRPQTDDEVSLSLGGYGGLLWNVRTKQVSDANGTVKFDGDFGVNRYRYGLMGRIDFKWFDFYVMYNLSPMFTNSDPTDAQQVMAGINFINF